MHGLFSTFAKVKSLNISTIAAEMQTSIRILEEWISMFASDNWNNKVKTFMSSTYRSKYTQVRKSHFSPQVAVQSLVIRCDLQGISRGTASLCFPTGLEVITAIPQPSGTIAIQNEMELWNVPQMYSYRGSLIRSVHLG